MFRSLRKPTILAVALVLAALLGGDRLASAQVIGVQPTPIGLYAWDTSNNQWDQVPNSSTAQPYYQTPQAFAFYGWNASLHQWTPCTTAQACGIGAAAIGPGVAPEVPYYNSDSSIEGDPYLQDNAANTSGAGGLLYTGNGALFATAAGGSYSFDASNSATTSNPSNFNIALSDAGGNAEGANVNITLSGSGSDSGNFEVDATGSAEFDMTGAVELDTDQDIDLYAGGDVNISPAGAIYLNSDTINIQGPSAGTCASGLALDSSGNLVEIACPSSGVNPTTTGLTYWNETSHSWETSYTPVGVDQDVPTVAGALSNYNIPVDNGTTHDWTSSTVAVPPSSISAADLSTLTQAGSTILPNNFPHTVFTNTNGNLITDYRRDIPANPISVKTYGAQCDAVLYTSGAAASTTQGSNQVVFTNVGAWAHTPIPGESLSIVGTVSGVPTVWEPIVVSYNSGTSTATTYDNAPFSATAAPLTYGHDDTAAFQYVMDNYNWTELRGTPTVPDGNCLVHRVHADAQITLDGTDRQRSTMAGEPGEDVFDSYDPSIDSGSSTNAWDMGNLSFVPDDRIDARQAWTQIVTLPSSCNATFTSCTVTTNSIAGVQRFLGRSSIHANNPLGPGWCQTSTTSSTGTLCVNEVAAVTNGVDTITVATGETAPTVGTTLVFPYLTPAFETTVSSVAGQVVTLAANYPGATSAQQEFFAGNTFQTLETALASSGGTQIALTLPATPSPLAYANVGTDGLVQIDSEQISYHLVDYNNSLLLNIVRGANGTTPAAHSIGALIVPLNPFVPSRPWPVNPTVNSNSQTPAGAEYYPAFAVGNAGIGLAVQNGANAPSTLNHGVWNMLSIYGDNNYSNGTVGILSESLPYGLSIANVQAAGLYWGIVETLPINNGAMGNTSPDTSGTWNSIYMFNNENNIWKEFGGSYGSYTDFETHVGLQTGYGSLIEANCEQYDWSNLGFENYIPSLTQPNGTWSGIYGEALFDKGGTTPLNYEPEQWCGSGSLNNFDLYTGYQQFIISNNLAFNSGSIGNSPSNTFPTVIYGNNNILQNYVDTAYTGSSSNTYGDAPFITYGSGSILQGSYTPTGDRVGSTPWTTPPDLNVPSADFAATGNFTVPYINKNSGVIPPSQFSTSVWDADSFWATVNDPTSLFGQAELCPGSASYCESMGLPATIQIERNSRVTPQTYTGYIPYRIDSGTATETLEICASTVPPSNGTCTTSIATQTVTATSSWQTAEMDNVDLSSYAGDWIGIQVNSFSDTSKSYFVGGFILMPVAQNLHAVNATIGTLTVGSCTGCGGGSSAFSALTSGTNTIAAMVVGSGASLAPTGTGTIQATDIASTISPGTNVTITGSGTVADPYVITSSSTASTAFSALTGSTNTMAAMLVGTGASLGPTGSGTVNANELNGATAPASTLFAGLNSSSQLVAATTANLASFLSGLTGCTNAAYAYVPHDSQCESVGGSGPTIQTNGTNNSSQSTLNFITSTINSAGFTITPSNPSGGEEKLELTGTLAAGSFPALTGDVTNTAGSLSTTVGKLENLALPTLASSTGFLYDNAGTLSLSTSAANLTSGTLPNARISGLPLANLATQAADSVVMNASGSSAVPTAVAMPTGGTNGCAGSANALIYNTSTHAWGCNTISGSGTVDSGSGYAMSAYGSSASTTVGPSNITTDSTGNNLSIPGQLNLTATGVATQETLTYNSGHAPSGTSGSAVIAPDTSGNLDVSENNGTFNRVCTAGNGECTQTIASGTATLGTSAIASGACATVITVSASGVASTDSITWTPNASIKAVTGYAPSTSGGLSIAAYPTSGDVNFDVCNWSAGSITPGAVTLNWRVTR